MVEKYVLQGEAHSLYGQVVRTSDPARILIFCPELMFVEEVPLVGDKYILACRMRSDEFRSRFQKSVLLSDTGIDLDNREYALSLLGSIPVSHTQRFKQFSEHDFWKYVRIYRLTAKLPLLEEDESRVYSIFTALGASPRVVISEFFASGAPAGIIFASMITFLHKALRVDDLSKANKVYLKDLKQLRSRVKDIRRPLLDYLRSERETSDLLYMLIRL